MIAPQQFGCYPVFGCAATKCQPQPVKYETGYIPGDVLPAEHLNWFLGNDTAGYNLLCAGVSSIEQELATLLSCAGCTPDPTSCSQVYNAVMYQINACITACSAPKSHASSANTYGVGNADCYGHLKLSDTYDSVLEACQGVAASQFALATAYACLSCCGAQLGDTAGCALGTASAGVAGTAARSDHVHPIPEEVKYSRGLVAPGSGDVPSRCYPMAPANTGTNMTGPVLQIVDGCIFALNTVQLANLAYCADFATCANALRIQPHSSCNALVCVKCRTCGVGTYWTCVCAKTNMLVIPKAKSGSYGCANACYVVSGDIINSCLSVCMSSWNEGKARDCVYKCYYFIQLSCVID